MAARRKTTDKRTKADKEAQEKVVGGTARENFEEQEGAGEPSDQAQAGAEDQVEADTTLVSRESGYFWGTGVVAATLDQRLPGYADIPLGSPRAAQILAEERERGHDVDWEKTQQELADNAKKDAKEAQEAVDKHLENAAKENEKALKDARKSADEGGPADAAVESTFALKASSGAMGPDEVEARINQAEELDARADTQEADEEAKDAEKDAEEKKEEHEKAQKELKEANKAKAEERKQAEKNLEAQGAPGVNADNDEEAQKSSDAQRASSGVGESPKDDDATSTKAG